MLSMLGEMETSKHLLRRMHGYYPFLKYLTVLLLKVDEWRHTSVDILQKLKQISAISGRRDAMGL